MPGLLQPVSELGVWLVIGVQAAGKSTVSELLAGRFERGVHVRGGQFYRWALSGWVQPHAGEDSQDARRLLDLRYRLSAITADEYATEGFTVVVQDNIFGSDVTTWLDRVKTRPRHLVVLRPALDEVAARDRARRARTGKVAYRPDDHTIEGLDEQLALTPRLGLWLDTTRQTPHETVADILTHQADARLDP